ncbi:MAG TPA: sigma 54-interacting transcriptional regulator [Candidatus Angelobacter sp.]|nr:sigma 54-interacting transcriptional regulator [Candidatus Angelobacter sp.]
MNLGKTTAPGSFGTNLKSVNGKSMPSYEMIFGKSAAMAAVHKTMNKVAATAIPVLITGESGTGKDVIARLIHLESQISSRPFVQVNCAAIPATLLESELFGHEKGSFTGALVTKPGRIEMANGGTLFLDEIGEFDSSIQAKVLHVLQDSQFTRIGGQEDKQVSVRFIFATNRDLPEEIALGNFREDLFYRINVVNIHLPPLRERLEDVPLLCEYFIAQHNEKFNCRAPALSDQCMSRLQAYHWPGNIRQLENLTKRYAILGSEDAILSEITDREPDIFKFVIPPQGDVPLKQITKQAVLQVEKKIILKVVEDSNWNRKRAAKRLKISYRALLYKLKQAGVHSDRRGSASNQIQSMPDAPAVGTDATTAPAES